MTTEFGSTIEQCDVLDHGFVRLVETWGSDERIIEAARMSTDKGFEGWGPVHAAECPQMKPRAGLMNLCDCQPQPGDEKLLSYLYTNWHHTPFEMGGLTLEIQAPIFVFREWHRHRTQSYNELSARYVPVPDVNYMPSVARCLMPGGNNKQARGLDGAVLDETGAAVWSAQLQQLYDHVQRVYEMGLALGVPKELARLPVSVGRYSRMRASANLRNWLAFLTLRLEPNAQWEIRCYAHAVAQFVEKYFARTYALFNNKRTEACVTLELYRACQALVSAQNSDHPVDERNAVERIKFEITKIDAAVELRKLA